MNKSFSSAHDVMTLSSEDCLSDEQLNELLEELQTWPQQSALIAHLDTCESCRMRLETTAADGQQWDAVRHNLRDSGVEESAGP